MYKSSVDVRNYRKLFDMTYKSAMYKDGNFEDTLRKNIVHVPVEEIEIAQKIDSGELTNEQLEELKNAYLELLKQKNDLNYQ